MWRVVSGGGQSSEEVAARRFRRGYVSPEIPIKPEWCECRGFVALRACQCRGEGAELL